MRIILAVISFLAVCHILPAGAQSHAPVTENVITTKARFFNIKDVRLLDSPFSHAMKLMKSG